MPRRPSAESAAAARGVPTLAAATSPLTRSSSAAARADSVFASEIPLAPALAPVAQMILERAGHSFASLHLRLDHEDLGSIEVVLHRQRGGIRVELTAELAETAKLLTGGAPALAQELRAAGVGIESVSVGGGWNPASGGEAARDDAARSGRDTLPLADARLAAEIGPGGAPHAIRQHARTARLDLTV